MNKRISLKQAVGLHGHLGPYLVIGLLAGELGLKKISANKYFGISVKVWGAGNKPKSCLVDGLQLSTGATYGKGNINKMKGNSIRILMRNLKNDKKLFLALKPCVIDALKKAKTHQACENLARKIFKEDPGEIFDILSLT